MMLLATFCLADRRILPFILQGSGPSQPPTTTPPNFTGFYMTNSGTDKILLLTPVTTIGANRAIFCAVGWSDNGGFDAGIVSSVTLSNAGNSFTLVCHVGYDGSPFSGPNCGASIYVLTNAPVVTDDNVRVEFDNPVSYATVLGSVVTNAGTVRGFANHFIVDTESSVSVGSSSSDLVLDQGIGNEAFGHWEAGQIVRSTNFAASTFHGISSKAGAASVNMRWTGTDELSDPMIHQVISIQRP